MGTWAELEIGVDDTAEVKVQRTRTADPLYILDVRDVDRNFQLLLNMTPEVADRVVAALRKARLVPVAGGAA